MYYGLPINREEELVYKKYLYKSYEDTIVIQIYLADNNLPLSYTDSLSFSELHFIYNQVKEFVKEKNSVQNK